MVETETISSSFIYKQQGLAQCLDYSRAWINTLTEYINELKENSRLFLSKMVWNWPGQKTRSVWDKIGFQVSQLEDEWDPWDKGQSGLNQPCKVMSGK